MIRKFITRTQSTIKHESNQQRVLEMGESVNIRYSPEQLLCGSRNEHYRRHLLSESWAHQ